VRLKIFIGAAIAALAMLCLPALASAQGYTTKTLHFIVHVGPGNDTECNVIGQLYRPKSATKAHPAPSILTTNGFGGSYKSQAVLGEEFAKSGYVVLSYSGLGFGGSSCRVTIDGTQWDGEAAKDLVTFLGGGSKATNGAKVNYVELNKRAHNGKHYAHDPEVGMIGLSYGGAVQFAAAADDPRIDTIVPMATWNSIVYSLAPNNATLKSGTVEPTTPGVTKTGWLGVFWGLGTELSSPVKPYGGASSCPNFSQPECTADSQLTTDGYASTSTDNIVKDSSVANFMNKIKVPTMLMQGEDDTLFTLHEAVATYNGLRAEHTPVKMVWQSWGHSNATTPRAGELGAGGASLYTSSGKPTVEGRMIENWMSYYLKHKGAKPALNFSFNRPWVSYKGDDAAKAYASAPKYPVATDQSMYLSGSDSLVSSSSEATAGQATFTVPNNGALESESDNPPSPQPPPSDPAGGIAEFESPPLTKAVDVVGIPSVAVTVSEPQVETDALAGAFDSDDTLGLFFKLEDISPSGTVTLPDGLVSAARIASDGGKVTIDLPGIVHQFAAHDKIALVIAGSDASYFLPNPGAPVLVTTGGTAGVLKLPVAKSGSYGPVKYTAK